MDKKHLQFLRYAIQNKHNIFGICRGFQLLCYEYLLNKYDFIEYRQDISGHNQQNIKVARNNPYHEVNYKDNKLFVNSMHHQAVISDDKKILGCNEITFITKYSSPKNKAVVEGLSFNIDSVLISGVQWHPEELDITKEEFESYKVK